MNGSELLNIAEGAVEVYNANRLLDDAVTDLVNLHNISRDVACMIIFAIDHYDDQLGQLK